MLALVTGRNHIRQASFKVTDSSGNVSLQVAQAEREPRAGEEGTSFCLEMQVSADDFVAQGSLRCEDDEIRFMDIPAFETVDVTIPYYGTDRGSGISV